MARTILFSGKGGVGKTSMSAATSLGMARQGLRTLVLSADPAHSLGDVFAIKLGPQAVAVETNLWAAELDVRTTLDSHWDHIAGYIEAVLKSQGVDHLLATELSQLPGLEELISLLELERLQAQYDVLILDCAPTGSTVRLLAFPEAMHWYMERFFPLERKLVRAVKPLAEKLTRMPMPEDVVFDQVDSLYRRVRGAAHILRDRALTTVRLVATPDAVVLAETRRAFSMLTLHGIHVDGLLLNRVFPADQADNPLLSRWVAAQQEAGAQIEQDFNPVPVVQIPFQAAEPQGLAGLEPLLHALASTFQVAPLHGEEPFVVDFLNPDTARVRINLPLPDHQDLHLWVDGSELVFVYHSFFKRWAIPDALLPFKLHSAAWEGSQFAVRFVRRGTAARGGI